MDPREVVRYNHLLRRRFAEFFVKELDWDVLGENVEISHESIAATFMHGCNMEDWYLHSVVPGEPWDGPAYDGFTSADDMLERVRAVEAKTSVWMEKLSDEDLAAKHEIKTDDGSTATVTLAEILVEVVLEDSHHRGEIMGALWQKDIATPYVPFATFAART